jgi:hypothetical protein
MPGRSGTSRLDNLRAQRIAAGYGGDNGLTRLAQLACVSDATIKRLEDGGSDEPAICQRIADVLGVSLATLGEAKL